MEYKPPPIITLEQLQRALKRGTRFCDKHSPRQTGENNDKWEFHLARLPWTLQDLTEYELRKLTAGRIFGMSTEDDMKAGCHSVHVLNTPEVAAFAHQAGVSLRDPDLRHQPVRMAFVRMDLVKFTRFEDRIQARALSEIHELIVSSFPNGESLFDGSSQLRWTPKPVLHTGDGFVIPISVPDKIAEREDPIPLGYAIRIAQAMDEANRFRMDIHFRISVTMGRVYKTGDLSGRPNYVGGAINESERLLSCLPPNLDDVVCFSYDIYRQFMRGIESLSIFRLGTGTDKHGQPHRLYMLEYNSPLTYQMDFSTSDEPSEGGKSA